jgi:hypothetical protein
LLTISFVHIKQAALRVLAITVLFVLLGLISGSVAAQGLDSPDSFTCITNRTLLRHDAELTLVTADKPLDGGILVFTNGTYSVNKGKIRTLQPGQYLRTDGFLVNPDNSIVPVFDHITQEGGRVMVFKDGDGTAITGPLTLPDGSIINPDGSYSRGTKRARLVDGQLLTLSGGVINRLDTITYKDGRVFVYKNGVIIPLQTPDVIMGMYDGSKVRGDGFVTFGDGSTLQLTNGQMVTVTGVRPDW